ncbi:PIN domain-containing protein [Ornithinimicrobium sp. F0845]|uniref:PIN domain-containing protein n=1 Tax=Ornithinimicrobium sp. F0845 TaxID=2926412 RepID=UPI001FF30AAF|nr:PIN domain-containing protein [Ornithinimicrobium sp. F0845]MCK0112401.1 PIN domain-containing protein [Ornithinimicrobium sp. F0845]
MTERVFLDTNVVVYAFDAAEQSAPKRETARAVLGNVGYDLCVSAQVLGEFFVTVTRKLPRPLSLRDAASAVAELSALGPVPTDADLVAAAVETSQQAQLSYWDSLIVVAASRARCPVLLTEDLSDGSVIRGVRIENPFRGR